MSNRAHRRYFRAPAGAALLLLAIAVATSPGCESDRSPQEEKANDVAADTSGHADATALQAPTADSSADSAAGGPRISFPEPSHDFGHVNQGTKVTHVFAVRNTGTEPLKLIRAKGS